MALLRAAVVRSCPDSLRISVMKFLLSPELLRHFRYVESRHGLTQIKYRTWLIFIETDGSDK
jgi:hypothetical protein